MMRPFLKTSYCFKAWTFTPVDLMKTMSHDSGGGSGTCVHLSLPSDVLIFVHNYHSSVFVFLTVTMAMRDMGRASVSQLSGTTQLPPQRTAALVKATLIAPGKSND